MKLFKAPYIFCWLVISFLASCKPYDDVTLTPINPGGGVTVDDATMVTASLSGIVLDETNNPIVGAIITSGAATTTSNTSGMFNFSAISLSKNNGSVTVTKTGYFKGVKSFKTSISKNHFVKIQLMQKVLSGTIIGTNGGVINSNGGAKITFPANSFITTSGAVYSGSVKVYSRWIDPTANNLAYIIPGDLRGITTAGAENILETYGMVGAELEDLNGNTLSIAPDKKATITFPIPASIATDAPASIKLWHFDNPSARWKEEGTATKSGANYTADVNKFSFWNCDRSISDYIVLDYTLLNAATNSPLVATATRIKIVSSSFYGYGITNNNGFVSGLVPRNEALILEVVTPNCSTVIYSQNIGPFNNNTSLGNVLVTLPPSQVISFSGKLLNCNAGAVTNGYVSLYATGGIGAYATTNATGNFSFSVLNCTNSSITYNYQGVDNTTNQQTTLLTGTVTSGNVNLGNLTACTNIPTAEVYVTGFEPLTINTGNNAAKVWKNGVVTNLSDGTKNGLGYSVYVDGTDVYVAGSEQDIATGFVTVKVWKNGVATSLTNGTATAQGNGVFVSGGNVYVAGSENGIAKIWKNGVATNLTNGSSAAHAKAVFVSGSDVYVVGVSNLKATIWKNGVATTLSNNVSAEASSVFVSGTDVYVAGKEYNGSFNVAKLWKNGVVTNLSDGTTSAAATSVYVVGADVYVAGQVTNPTGFYTVAKIWKNGVATNLTDGTRYGSASGVSVLNNVVYVVGTEQNTNGTNIIKVWKDNLPINITDGSINSAFGTSIFVK